MFDDEEELDQNELDSEGKEDQEDQEEEQKDEKTFTQVELDKIVKDRLYRVKQKFTDHEGIIEELGRMGYTGTASEIKEQIRLQAEAYQNQLSLEEAEEEAERYGASAELVKEIRELKAEQKNLKDKLSAYEEQKENEKIANEKWQQELAEFEKKHPEIDFNKLSKDADFVEYVRQTNPALTITEKYEMYIKPIKKASGEQHEKFLNKLNRATASGKDGKSETYGLTKKQMELADENGISYKTFYERLSLIKKN